MKTGLAIHTRKTEDNCMYVSFYFTFLYITMMKFYIIYVLKAFIIFLPNRNI